MQNISIALASPAARTASFDVGFENLEASGLTLVIDITANPGGLGGITVTVQGVDAVSGKKYPILASAALTAVGTIVLRVGRSLVAAANLTANDQLPRKVNVSVVHANANPVTYSIGGSLIL